LRDNERVEEEGRKARKFVEKLSWANLTDEFEKVLGGGYMRWIRFIRGF
jgi:hypothetical protein